MAFMTLNGDTVRPALGTSRKNTRIGEIGRAYSGQAQSDVRANKAQWRFATVPLKEMEAEYIRGILLRQGHGWDFDSDGYSATGLGPNSSADIQIVASTGADGASVADQVKYGTGALECDETSTNILGADSRDAENAPTGYGAIGGGSLGADTTHYWQGAKSLSVGVSSASDGAYTTGVATTTGQVVYGSVYVKAAAAGTQVTLSIREATNAVTGTASSYTLTSAGAWYRLRCVHTISADDADTRLQLQYTAGGATTLYADAWQMEVGALTQWVDGTRSTANQLVFERVSWLQSQNVAVSFWTPGMYEGVGVFFDFLGDSSNYIRLIGSGQTSTNRLELETRIAGVSTYITKSTAWDGDYHHVAAVIRYNPETGEYYRQLWYDGVSVGTDNTGTLPDNTTFVKISVGSDASAGNQCNCTIDDLIVTPSPILDSTVSAWYTYGESLASIWPDVYLNGDIVDGRKRVMGVYNGEKYMVYGDGTAARINGRIIDGELWER